MLAISANIGGPARTFLRTVTILVANVTRAGEEMVDFRIRAVGLVVPDTVRGVREASYKGLYPVLPQL